MKKNKGYVALGMAILVGTIVTGAIIYLANQGVIKSKQFVNEIQDDRYEGILKQYVTQHAALFREELYRGVDPANPSGDINPNGIQQKQPRIFPTEVPRVIPTTPPKSLPTASPNKPSTRSPVVTPTTSSPIKKSHPSTTFLLTPKSIYKMATSLISSFSISGVMASLALPQITNNYFETSQTDLKCLANPDVENPKHRYIEPNPPAGKTIIYTCQELPPLTKGAILTAYFLDKNKVNHNLSATAYVSYDLPIGKIITSKGDYIKRTNKLVPEIDSYSPISFDSKTIPDRSNIFLHDLIQTTNSANPDDKQFVKIFLHDKTVVQIGPDSEFYFKKFHFQKVHERSTIYQLLKGTLQVLYGAKNNNEEMLIETPSIALGVRGTEYKLQVNETNLNYHTTMDVISGKVEVFDKSKSLIDTISPDKTFNHYRIKTQTTGFRVDGTVRTFEKNNFYHALPLPASVATPSPTTVNDNNTSMNQIVKINELIHIRRDNILLYGYFHNASRDSAKGYFQHIRDAGGWNTYYNAIRPSLSNEPLFIPNKAQYDGMSFPISQSPVAKSFEIAMMSPNGFDTTYDINLNFALVYDQNYSNNTFLLIYPAEDLDSLAQRFVPGPYTDIQNNIMISPLPGLKLKNGDIVGCGASICNDIGSLRAQIPSGYEVSRLITIGGPTHNVIPWPPIPVPVPAPVVIPAPPTSKPSTTTSKPSTTSKTSTKKTKTPTPPPPTVTCIKECKKSFFGYGKGKYLNCGSDPSCNNPPVSCSFGAVTTRCTP